MGKQRSVGIIILSSIIVACNIFSLVLFIKPSVLGLMPYYIRLFCFSPFLSTTICLAFHWHIAGLVLSLFFITVGISILGLKELARKLFIFSQILFLTIGLASVLFTLLWYGEMKHQGMGAITYITTQLLPTILNACFFPAVFLVCLTRPKVKAQFK